MGVLPIVLVILAMKIPIFGLLWLVWWAGRPAVDGAEPEAEARRLPRPHRPQPTGPQGPRRRGPHGGEAMRPLPVPRREGVPAVAAARAPRQERSART